MIIDTGCSIMLLEMHCMLTHSIQYMHTLHMYISSCNENMEIEGAVWVLMDDILVTMNQVDLTRPSCIYLINATSEVCLLPCQFFLTPKGCDTNICSLSSYVILCTLVTECSLSDQRQIHSLKLTSWYFLF